MQLRRLQLTNFRNLQQETAVFPPGVSIVIGENGAGKTNLLEAAQYVCCGRSFRTNREQEMTRSGAGYFRLEAEVTHGEVVFERAAAYEPGAGVKVNPGGGPQWLPAGAVLCFSPDDLQLIKGAPVRRRRFLDEAISRNLPAYHRDLLDYQKVLSQRNRFLQRARAGLVRLTDISPWDRQLAALAVRLHAARADHCRRLTPHFQTAYVAIAGGGEPGAVPEAGTAAVRYVSQLDELGSGEELEGALVSALEERWSEDLERFSTGTGIHRDDVDFILEGRSLKPYGSQGEQRAAVLALLLADRSLGGGSGETPLLLLDDVMSELDPDRRRRLLASLAGDRVPGASAGEPGAVDLVSQTLITAADVGLFTDEELAAANVIEVTDGALRKAGVGFGV